MSTTTVRNSAREAQARELQDLLQKVKEQRDRLFYYSEEEELQKREPKRGGWSVLETIFHINRVNASYLDQLRGDFPRGTPGPAKTSWVGKMLLKTLKPGIEEEPEISYWKMKSPAAADPLKLQKKGHAVVADVIFREFVTDLDVLAKWIARYPEEELEKARIRSLVPFLKVNGWDVLLICLHHTSHHLRQAQRIIER